MKFTRRCDILSSMSKKHKIEKLDTGMSEEEITKKSRLTLICAVIAVVAAAALLFIPQTGLKRLPELYSWTKSAIVFLEIADFSAAVVCLVGHFTFYKLKREVDVRRLPTVLKGSWHTFAGLEISFAAAAAMALLEAFMLVRWFDVATLAAFAVSLAGAGCAFVVRSVTFKAYKGVSDGKNDAKTAEKHDNAKTAAKQGESASDEEIEDFFGDKE